MKSTCFLFNNSALAEKLDEIPNSKVEVVTEVDLVDLNIPDFKKDK